MRETTGLTRSICIAPNKLLAKIGSDFEKPDGLTRSGALFAHTIGGAKASAAPWTTACHLYVRAARP